MAARGNRNRSMIPLGSSSGATGDEGVDRPYPVIIATNQTETEITIDVDFHVDGALTMISGFEDTDLLITGTTATVTPTIAVRSN